eukprot:COSAG06_NODE_3292_length_5547_cov_22.916483_9_plen_119_part_00
MVSAPKNLEVEVKRQRTSTPDRHACLSGVAPTWPTCPYLLPDLKCHEMKDTRNPGPSKGRAFVQPPQTDTSCLSACGCDVAKARVSTRCTRYNELGSGLGQASRIHAASASMPMCGTP